MGVNISSSLIFQPVFLSVPRLHCLIFTTVFLLSHSECVCMSMDMMYGCVDTQACAFLALYHAECLHTLLSTVCVCDVSAKSLRSSIKKDACVVSGHLISRPCFACRKCAGKRVGMEDAEDSTQTFISSLHLRLYLVPLICSRFAAQQSKPDTNGAAGFKCCSGLLSPDLFKLPLFANTEEVVVRPWTWIVTLKWTKTNDGCWAAPVFVSHVCERNLFFFLCWSISSTS